MVGLSFPSPPPCAAVRVQGTQAPLAGAMDPYTTRKREEDGICRLALNNASQQKMQDLRSQQTRLLRQQVEQNKSMRKKLGEDIAVQSTLVKAQGMAIKQSRQPGSLKYRNGPQAGGEMPGGHGSYETNLQTLQQLTGNSHAVHSELAGLERAENNGQAHSDSGVNSMAAWFARYGEPKRQSHPEENGRSCLMKPRRTPHCGLSNACTLRRGWLTK